MALCGWDALAADAGVPADSSGFRGVTLSHIVRSDKRVDAVLAEAERAGGKIAKPAQRAPWGGYFGYFTDRDGSLEGRGGRRAVSCRIAEPGARLLHYP